MSKVKVFGAIFLIGFLVYFNSLFSGFIGDDLEQIFGNPYIYSLSNIPRLFTYGLFNPSLPGQFLHIYYKPLMPLAFTLIYSISGNSSFLYHLFQLFIHIINTFLVYLIFKRQIKEKISFFLSLVFLVLPLNQEAVANISSYQDVLFFFFGTLGFLMFTYKQNLNFFIGSFFLFLSLLSKESGILFLAIMPIYAFLFEKIKFTKSTAVSFVVFAIYLLLRLSIVNTLPVKIEIAPISTIGFYLRLINIPKMFFYYLKNFVWPTDLSISQQWIVKTVNISEFYIPLFIILAFLGICVCFLKILQKKKQKSYVFFLSWFLLGIGIHMQLIPLDMTVASRWFYFPSVGILGMAGVVLSELVTEKKEKVLYLILVILIAVFSVRTIIRNSNWRDALTLYSHDVSYSKGYIVENNLGSELFKVGRKEEARKYFESAIRENSEWWISWNNLGIYYENKSDYKNAEKYYKEAMKGNLPAAYENLARTYLISGDFNKAREFTKSSIKKLPNSPKLWVTLGIIEYKLGNKKEALAALKRSFKLFPALTTQNLYKAMQENQAIE